MAALGSIQAPGAGYLAGGILQAAQSDTFGASPQLQAQAAILGGVVSGALGVAAIASGGGVLVLLAGAMALAGAPVSVTLSGIFLAQGANGDPKSYSSAMQAVSTVSSPGGLLGFTLGAIASGGNADKAARGGRIGSLAERALSLGSPTNLAEGYELGTFVVDLQDSVAAPTVEKPTRAQAGAKPSGTGTRMRDIDGRDSSRGGGGAGRGIGDRPRPEPSRPEPARAQPEHRDPIDKPGGSAKPDRIDHPEPARRDSVGPGLGVIIA
jgi:hypothetical protein